MIFYHDHYQNYQYHVSDYYAFNHGYYFINLGSTSGFFIDNIDNVVAKQLCSMILGIFIVLYTNVLCFHVIMST